MTCPRSHRKYWQIFLSHGNLLYFINGNTSVINKLFSFSLKLFRFIKKLGVEVGQHSPSRRLHIAIPYISAVKGKEFCISSCVNTYQNLSCYNKLFFLNKTNSNYRKTVTECISSIFYGKNYILLLGQSHGSSNSVNAVSSQQCALFDLRRDFIAHDFYA